MELTGAERQAELETRQRRGSSFGTAAAAYAQYRPGYAEAAADSLVAAIATHSNFLVMAEPDRARLLAEVRDFLHARPETGTGELVFPMVTAALRATRT